MPSKKPETVTHPDIPERIARLKSLTFLTEWEQAFLESVGGSYEKWGSFTKGQYQTFCEVEKRNSPEEVKAREDWVAAWNEEKKNVWHRMMGYYANMGQYFTGLVNVWAKNPDYIPTQKEYVSVCENKYAKRLRQLDALPPVHKPGDLVTFEVWYGTVLAMVVRVGNHQCPAAGTRLLTLHVITDTAGASAYGGPMPVYEEKYCKFFRGTL